MFPPLYLQATFRPQDNTLSRLVFCIFLISAMLLSSIVHAIPLPGTQIGTQASATYSIASGNDVQVFSNKVKTTIKALPGLTVEGSDFAEGKQELLTTVVNTGNVSIAKLALSVESLSGAKTYFVNGEAIAVGGVVAFAESAIEAGAIYQFKSVFDAEMEATATIKVIAYDANGIKLVESAEREQTSHFTDKMAFHAVVADPEMKLIRSEQKPVNFRLGLSKDATATAQKRVMAFDIAFGDNAKGLEFIPQDFEVMLNDGGGSLNTPLKPGQEDQWSQDGEVLKAKLMRVDQRSLRLLIELNETGEERARLSFNIGAKTDAVFSVHRFNARFGEGNWDTGDFVNSAKVSLSAPIKVTVASADADGRSVTLTHPENAPTVINAVDGQIIGLRALVKNDGEAADKIVLKYTGTQTFPIDTVFSWNDVDVTTNEDREQELALEAGEERLLTFSVKLPPHAPLPPQVAMLNSGSDHEIVLSAQPKGVAEPVAIKLLSYKIKITERSVVLNTEGNQINYLVDPASATTMIKLKLQNGTSTSTTNPSHDLYSLTAALEGLDVKLYEAAGDMCGPAPGGATATMTSDKIPAGGLQNICVAAIGKNGGLIEKINAELVLTVTPTLGNSTPVTLKLNLYLGQIDQVADTLEKKVVRGSSVSFVHQINNTGAATFTIGKADVTVVNNKKGWTSTFIMSEGVKDSQSRAVDTLVIAPGASGRIEMTVTAPMDGTPGEYDAATLTVKGMYAHSDDVHALFSVIYTSQMETEGGMLVKQQSLDASCNITTPNYSQNAIDAEPGQCVWYQVQLTNTAETTIDKVTLTDSLSRYAEIDLKTITLKSANGQVNDVTVANSIITGKYGEPLTTGSTLTLEYQVKIAQ